ncbi:MAG: hypothetical protein K6A42_00290, partial [Treponema sp.]|nr:hypothetical protein [Treponema sp.]
MKFKSRYIKIGICIFIFLFLLAVSNRILLPVYNRVGTQIQKTMESIQTGLIKKSGLSISYKSLSPSILSGINVNGIVLRDAQSGEEVATISRLSLGYSLKALVSKDVKDSLQNLVLRDVDISVLRGKNDYWLSALLEKGTESNEQSEPVKLNGDFLKAYFEGLNLDDVKINLSSDLKIYRLRLFYKDQDVSCEANVSKAFLSANGPNKIDASVFGSFDASVYGKKVAGSLDFSSVIPRGINGSSAVLRFSDMSVGDYRVRYIGFLAEYKSKRFALKMLPSVRNVYFESAVDFASGDVNASLFADGFNLGNLAQTERGDKITQSLFALNFSLNAVARYNFKSGLFDYTSSGDIYVPGVVIP